METKKRDRSVDLLWLTLGAAAIPLALAILFQLLKSSRGIMSGWVWFVMAPLEQALGRLWSLFPFSAAEVLAALFLLGCAVWLVRAVVLVCRQKAPLPFLRRLLALASVWLWLWAGLCWLWNAAYYIPSFAQREGLSTEQGAADRSEERRVGKEC